MIWECVCIFCVLLPLCQSFHQELLDAMSVQAQRFSSHHSQEVAQAFSKPGNFASTVMTTRIEKSLKNSVFVLIPVFLSDFLFLTLQGHAWSSQSTVVNIWCVSAALPSPGSGASQGCKGTDCLAKSSIKNRGFEGCIPYSQLSRLYLVTLGFLCLWSSCYPDISVTSHGLCFGK